jgi:hypothetical protein
VQAGVSAVTLAAAVTAREGLKKLQEAPLVEAMSTELARTPYSMLALRAVLADAAAMGVQYCTEAVLCCQQVTFSCFVLLKYLLWCMI